MPERPECHIAALKLEHICKDKLITSIEIHGDVIRNMDISTGLIHCRHTSAKGKIE